MTTHQHDSERGRKGQTLAEFALTLPILLLLLFGIIEFGRLFQSWVTLQNAARTAVRYASTGQFKEDRYPLELVPCIGNSEGQVPIGAIYDADFPLGRDAGTMSVQLYAVTTDTAVGPDNSEDFYASWYGDPTGCAPGPETDQNRKDMLRLPSIYEEARRGAAGLLIENSRVSPNYDSVQDYLYSQFQRPHPSIDSLDWFDVVICSSRDKMWSDDVTEILDLETGVKTLRIGDTARFQLVTDGDQYAPAACVLREAPIPEQDDNLLSNGLVPWMDAGSPGDRVTVVITYNHRLITPIGIADKVTLQAQRSAINEAFRVSNAPSGPVPPALPSPTQNPDIEDDPEETEPPDVITQTFTPSPTFTETSIPDTPTDAPFNCDNIDAFFREAPFSGNRLFIEFANFNSDPAFLLESDIYWNKPTAAQEEFPNMVMSNMALDADIYWFGEDDQSPTIATDEGDLVYDLTTQDHFIFVPAGGEKSDWQGQFVNGPSNMYAYFTIYDFANTRFVFDNPDSTENCEIFVYIPPIPTDTPEPPGYNSPTPTYTPDCASLTLSVEFVAFEIAGDVTLRIINDGPKNAPFTGFNILWPPMSGVGLDKVVFGGKNALDTPDVGGQGIIMWDSPLSGGDKTNNTDSATEQSFITEVTVPAYSNTLVHLDFVGVANKLPASPSDFNGSRFDIWCGFPGTPFSGGPTSGTGGGGNPGGDGDGSIFLAEVDTPVPTDLPPPTWTPLVNTFTPTPIPPSAVPTDTFTPEPTIPSKTPSNTPPATNTPTPTNTPGFGGGSSD